MIDRCDWRDENRGARESRDYRLASRNRSRRGATNSQCFQERRDSSKVVIPAFAHAGLAARLFGARGSSCARLCLRFSFARAAFSSSWRTASLFRHLLGQARGRFNDQFEDATAAAQDRSPGRELSPSSLPAIVDLALDLPAGIRVIADAIVHR